MNNENNNNIIITCEECGREIPQNEAYEIWTDGHQYESVPVCDTCMEDIQNDYDTDSRECCGCGSWYSSSDCGCYVHNGDWYCDGCIEDDWFYCDGCGDYFNNNDLNELDGNYYCGSCYNDRYRETLVYNYHAFNKWHEYRTSGDDKDCRLIGFELEIENTNDYNIEDVHELITSNINSVLMHDSSLSYGGLEIVSHPQSFNYIMEQKDKYFDTFKRLREEYGFTSHDNGRCGLHFHITRPSDEVVNRVILITETYKDELIKFSRRGTGDRLRWSKFYDEWSKDSYSVDKKGIKNETLSLEFIDKNKTRPNRYMTINNTNTKTIEFRLIRGTLNGDTFFASLELINNIVRVASDLSIDINTITWEMLINTPYCSEYCRRNNIVSTKVVKDYTNDIKAIMDNVAKEVDIIKEIVDQYLKREINDYNKNCKVNGGDIDELRQRLCRLANLKGDIDYLKTTKMFDGANVNDLNYRVRCVLDKMTNKYYIDRVKKHTKEVSKLCV